MSIGASHYITGYAVGFTQGAIVASLAFINRRWLLWNLRCQRGRRCAMPRVTRVSPNTPAGSVIYWTYTCAGCGTHYKASALVGEGGAFTESERRIVHDTTQQDIVETGGCISYSFPVGDEDNGDGGAD